MGDLAVADARKEFAGLTKRTRRDRQAERAFLASKLQIVRTLPTDDLAARTRVVSRFLKVLRKTSARDFNAIIRHLVPTPGGVGYGMFYNAPFKSDFQTGTAIYWEIVCPNPPGGNVNTYLYLTATNRSAKGVEAFISYNGQNNTFFKVFDWARTDTWQTNVSFASLGNYLRTLSAHGTNYQVLPVMNITARTGNSWLQSGLAVKSRHQQLGPHVSGHLLGDLDGSDDRLGWVMGTHHRDVSGFVPEHESLRRPSHVSHEP